MTTDRSPSLDTVKGFYRGWTIAGVSALSIGTVLGTAQFAFSLFILPLEETFGWSRTQVNGALTCGVISGLLSPAIGKLMDRVGAKWTMAGSVALVAIAFLLRAGMTELWQFYLFSILMFAGTPGATMLLAFSGTSSKLILGRLSETMTARLAFVVIIILQGAGLAVLVVSGGSMASWGGIVVLGLGMGGVGALTPLLIADTFGLRQFGSIMGLTRVPIIVPVFVGPIMAGMVFDATGGYNLVFLITIGMWMMSVGAFLLAKTHPRKENHVHSKSLFSR